MAIFEHSNKFDDAVIFSRFDEEHPLSLASVYPFELEGSTWLTAEHYYQASKFVGSSYAEKIVQAASPLQAYKLGNVWFKRKRSDFKQVRCTLMTRALYSKARQNPAVADFLLASDERLIVESSQYDHFWGIGRDQRGENTMGKIWMDIRRKLRSNPDVSQPVNEV